MNSLEWKNLIRNRGTSGEMVHTLVRDLEIAEKKLALAEKYLLDLESSGQGGDCPDCWCSGTHHPNCLLGKVIQEIKSLEE